MDMTELELLGQVDPPAPAVLEAAREVLWSAVAAEMLAAGPAGDASTARGTTEGQSAQRRRPHPGA